MALSHDPRLGIVAIGRNEGDRLKVCLRSALSHGVPIVYVDSGSTDDSVAFAASIGVTVVDLDLSIPFTAARARNAGAERLFQLYPDLEFVQFIDGDCEFMAGWLDAAVAAFDRQSEAVVMVGRLRERFPDRTLYNQLCDLEWGGDRPAGEVTECGGIAMMRRGAFQAVGGFNPDLIAGEEPELCCRLRLAGGKIFRLRQEMAWHDANMQRFGQWWKRAFRSGHAYGEGAWIHGRSPLRHWVKESRSIRIFGLGLPIVALGTAPVTWGLSLVIALAIYFLQMLRVYQHCYPAQMSRRNAMLYAFFCILAKIPQALGQLRFHWLRLQGKRSRIVEYKTSPSS